MSDLGRRQMEDVIVSLTETVDLLKKQLNETTAYYLSSVNRVGEVEAERDAWRENAEVAIAHANVIGEELDAANAKIERMKWLDIYRPGHDGGICRMCSGKENNHRMYCQHYVGKLEHKLHFVDINGTFGGYDYSCSCGGSFRRGGLAGHGDGTNDAEVVCPRAAETWRGPREETEALKK